MPGSELTVRKLHGHRGSDYRNDVEYMPSERLLRSLPGSSLSKILMEEGHLFPQIGEWKVADYHQQVEMLKWKTKITSFFYLVPSPR